MAHPTPMCDQSGVGTTAIHLLCLIQNVFRSLLLYNKTSHFPTSSIAMSLACIFYSYFNSCTDHLISVSSTRSPSTYTPNALLFNLSRAIITLLTPFILNSRSSPTFQYSSTHFMWRNDFPFLRSNPSYLPLFPLCNHHVGSAFHKITAFSQIPNPFFHFLCSCTRVPIFEQLIL